MFCNLLLHIPWLISWYWYVWDKLKWKLGPEHGTWCNEIENCCLLFEARTPKAAQRHFVMQGIIIVFLGGLSTDRFQDTNEKDWQWSLALKEWVTYCFCCTCCTIALLRGLACLKFHKNQHTHQNWESSNWAWVWPDGSTAPPNACQGWDNFLWRSQNLSGSLLSPSFFFLLFFL